VNDFGATVGAAPVQRVMPRQRRSSVASAELVGTDRGAASSAGAGHRGPVTSGASPPTASIGGLLAAPTANAAGAPSTSSEGATAEDPFALHLAARTVPSVVSARVDAAVALAERDPRDAHRELLAIYQDDAFPGLPAFTRARVMVNLATSFHALGDINRARLQYEAALASGALDAYQQERALEGLRRVRGGRIADGGDAPDAAQVAALEARVTVATAEARNDPARGPELMRAIYVDPAFPHLSPRVRARVLFDFAAALQLAGRASEAISHYEEALGSGLLDGAQAANARDAIHTVRLDGDAEPRSPEMLAAMIDGAVALQSDKRVARDMLLRVYRNPGFRALDARQRGRCLYDLAAAYTSLGQAQEAWNFWLEALSSGGLDDSHRERANRYLRGVLPSSVPVDDKRGLPRGSAPEAEREPGVPEARGEIAREAEA